MPPKVAIYFFHECDIFAIEQAYLYDFDKSFGERIDKKIIATCYAFLDITGESSRYGTWFQGKKVWEELCFNQIMYSRAAGVLRDLCKAKKFDTRDAFLNKFLEEPLMEGTLTCNLLPLSFSGEGRSNLLR